MQFFKEKTGRAQAIKTAQGGAGFDNPRENIDPNIKTFSVISKELRTQQQFINTNQKLNYLASVLPVPAPVQSSINGSAVFAAAGAAAFNEFWCFSAATTDYTRIDLVKSESNTLGTYATTSTASILGYIGFYGIRDSDKTPVLGARIYASQNGVSNNRIPCDLIITSASSTGVTSNQLVCATNGNVGIGTGAPVTSAKLDITSTTGALLVPRMTTTQRDALTAVNGMIIYNSSLNKFQGYENSAWASFI